MEYNSKTNRLINILLKKNIKLCVAESITGGRFAFEIIKKEYEVSPNTFGSSTGKKESQLELLIIVANQIISEYKDFEIILNKGIPEIIKVKTA